MPFLEGWDGPSLVTAIVAILGLLGSFAGYWFGQYRAKNERQSAFDRKNASDIIGLMPEADFLDYIGYLQGSHRCTEKAHIKFHALVEHLSLQTNQFHNKKLELARSALAASTLALDEYICQRFFSVGTNSMALQPDQNPDQTGNLDHHSPSYKQYFNWVDEMNQLASCALNDYRKFLSTCKQKL